MLNQDLGVETGKKIGLKFSEQETWSPYYNQVVSDLKNQHMYKQVKRCGIEREKSLRWMDKSSIKLFGQELQSFESFRSEN